MAIEDAERARRYRANRKRRDASVTVRDGEKAEVVTESVTEERHGVTETVTEVDRFGVVVRERFCRLCPGLKFKELIDHADHLATHNPSPAAWAAAYEKMTSFRKRKDSV